MASDDVAQLTEALAKTHVADAELSFRGLGLKLDNAASGQQTRNPTVEVGRGRDPIPASHCLLFVFPVEELVREIEQHPCLRALCLEGNTVGVDAARAIAKALESKDMLQVLISVHGFYTLHTKNEYINKGKAYHLIAINLFEDSFLFMCY